MKPQIDHPWRTKIKEPKLSQWDTDDDGAYEPLEGEVEIDLLATEEEMDCLPIATDAQVIAHYNHIAYGIYEETEDTLD